MTNPTKNTKNTASVGGSKVSTVEQSLLKRGGIRLMSEYDGSHYRVIYVVPTPSSTTDASIFIIEHQENRVLVNDVSVGQFMAYRYQTSPYRMLAKQIAESSLAQQRIAEVERYVKLQSTTAV